MDDQCLWIKQIIQTQIHNTMKIFLRTGAWYQSETKALTDDLELSELLGNPIAVTPKETVVCNCKKDIAALNERIDVLTTALNDKLKQEKLPIQSLSDFNDELNKPAEIYSKKMVTKSTVAKKASKAPAKKK